MSPTFYIAGGAFFTSVVNLFSDRFGKESISKLPGEADVLVLTGGEDINPALYRQKPIPTVYFTTERDDKELKLIERFQNKPKIGICRGGQILNVYNGGLMWQDVNGHGGAHLCVDVKTKKNVTLSSLHHQMMRPTADAEILTIAHKSTVKRDEFNDHRKLPSEEWEDIECVFYPKTKSLCYQPHPEIDDRIGRTYFWHLVNSTLNL